MIFFNKFGDKKEEIGYFIYFAWVLLISYYVRGYFVGFLDNEFINAIISAVISVLLSMFSFGIIGNIFIKDFGKHLKSNP